MSNQTENMFNEQQGKHTVLEGMPELEGQQRDRQALTIFAARLRGELILPGNADYEASRVNWSGTYDHHPAMIVRVSGVEDVQLAVKFAYEQGMPLAVRSGGHSIAGYSTNDGGMVIDLSLMKAINVDPEKRSARLESGLTWNEVAQKLQSYGLALSSGDTGTVGVGGLLLGGGIGWMVRKYGLTIDHVHAIELVTADGEFLRISADSNPELFWGLRGGGGNFGVVTAFEVDVYPAGIVLGGAVFYEMDEAEAILQKYARYASSAPDELTTMAMLMAAPPAPFIPPAHLAKPVVVIFVCYTGDLAQGERVIAPLRNLGTVVADVIAPIPYPVMFAFTEEASKRGFGQYVRSLFARTLSDDAIKSIVKGAGQAITPGTMVQIRILGGAMSRVPVNATAFAHRDKQAMISVFSTEWQPDNKEQFVRAEQWWQAIAPYTEGVYSNFLMEEGEKRVHQAYPPETYTRLVALKNRYDPTNLFHLNQNIVPTL